MSSGFEQQFQDAAVKEGASRARALGSDTVDKFKRSSLFLNGFALVVAGFLGIWSAFQLNVQGSIISAYVMLFGILLSLFATGMGKETLPEYFGFMYTPDGQLIFLLIAGNLAWCIGWVGVLVAIFTNFQAGYAFYSGRREAAGDAGVPNWSTHTTSQQAGTKYDDESDYRY